MSDFVVFRKAEDENQQPLREVFEKVEGVTIISSAVPCMATVSVKEDAIDYVRDIVKEQNLGMAPSRGVDLL